LLDVLDELPGESRRRAVTLFFFAGLAHRYEDERITEEIRDALPGRLSRLRGSGRFNDWKSEREWMPIMMEDRRSAAQTDPEARRQRDEYRSARSHVLRGDFPDAGALLSRRVPAHPGARRACARYGDPENRRVYMMSRDVEGRWLEMHARVTGIKPPID
jgi:hypothetical protein